MFTYQVLADTSGQRVDFFLAKESGLSRARIQDLIQSGNVKLSDEVVTKCHRHCVEGQTYHVTIPHVEPSPLKARDIPLHIVYEDSDLLVINKPDNFVVHPGAGHHEDTLVNALLHHCEGSLSGISGIERPGIVHRLDKDTTGLLVVAKNDATHIGLCTQFSGTTEGKSLKRLYKGYVFWNKTMPPQGIIDGAIGRDPLNRQRMRVTSHGKPSRTRYSMDKMWTLTKGLILARLTFELDTGRTHQIRAHCLHRKIPIFADPTYGTPLQEKRLRTLLGEEAPLLKRQALHAQCLEFNHPTQKTVMHFVAPMPYDLIALEEALDGYIEAS